MPEWAAGLSARRDRKNDVDMMSNCQPSLRAIASAFGTLGDSDRKSTRLNSSHSQISYAVFCLKYKTGFQARVMSSSRRRIVIQFGQGLPLAFRSSLILDFWFSGTDVEPAAIMEILAVGTYESG